MAAQSRLAGDDQELLCRRQFGVLGGARGGEAKLLERLVTPAVALIVNALSKVTAADA
jgi:hypothetical protein